MRVLLIEDSPGDVRLTLGAFRPTKAGGAVILTTVAEPADIAISSRPQANAYLAKPVQLEAIESLVCSTSDFEMTQTQLTNGPAR